MRTKLRPSIVLTVSTLVACAPPRGRKTHAAEPGKPIEWGSFAGSKELNPRDKDNRTIYARGDQCFVHLPPSGKQTSWQPPKNKQVDCPPEMDDPAWDACSGILARDGQRCVCTSDGNPPPPPREVPCPK